MGEHEPAVRVVFACGNAPGSCPDNSLSKCVSSSSAPDIIDLLYI
jgi:hypothetical protein